MKSKLYALLALAGLALSGCNNNNPDDEVLSQRYIHKYGYAVSKAEWDERDYPGQVITNMRNGVTVTATYEYGMLHGPTTYTFPHSQTVEHFYLYNQGAKVKEIHYNPMGMPVQERVQLSPSRYAITMWYNEGAPLLIEEFVGDELLEGQYFTASNEIESRVEKGRGVRLHRNAFGTLLFKEEIDQGFATKRETFYPNGAPQSIAHYKRGLLYGEMKTFAAGGEPLAIQEYVDGKLHGLSTYFNNGNKYLEVSYLHGQKNGVEKHYVDGEILTQEVMWENDQRHGPSLVYIDGNIERTWYYDGETVSSKKFEELSQLDEMIFQISPDVKSDRR
ncbi:MAG: toxin-antitoxin system YwqK family antitoxin [Parachlamydiales bacterium]